jgi:hypothetical protein
MMAAGPAAYNRAVNYFGHAVVAAWRSPEPAFALGAMLPDFAAMCRGELDGVSHPELVAGIEWHHATDRAFHRLPRFLELCRRLGADLERAGLGKGPARGAAHVGIELLLDGALLADGRSERYLDAIALTGSELGDEIARIDRAGRWRFLFDRLSDQGVPVAYRDPHEVARRTAMTLARRPPLAIDEAGVDLLAVELEAIGPELAADAETLLAQLAARLGFAEVP